VSAARAAADDRAALLARGRGRRAVKRTDAHDLAAADPGGLDLDAVPAPYTTLGDAALDDRERADLETCERAVAGLQRALAVAGKALATIHQARLYRESHATFEAYVEERWGMKRAHAYRLIEAWPVAAALSPIGDTNEAQVRELLPAVKRHGLEAARAVYEELREQGGRVTAARIREAVRVLPPRLAAPEQARDVIRAAAASRPAPPAQRTGEEDQDQDVVDAELVEEGPRAVAVLASVLERQRRLYDDLGGGLVTEALTADPGRAEHLLREIGRYAKRTAHRARPPAPDADDRAPGSTPAHT
jgi:hypothetical protein